MEPMEIPTVHGVAVLWWDDESDPVSPGWVLRYHRSPHPGETGLRNLDEILAAGPDPEEARREALVFLGRQGIGAGEQCGASDAARVAGLATRGAWNNTSWRPDPDGWVHARAPWWWESTILAAKARRPGRGARTDLTRQVT